MQKNTSMVFVLILVVIIIIAIVFGMNYFNDRQKEPATKQASVTIVDAPKVKARQEPTSAPDVFEIDYEASTISFTGSNALGKRAGSFASFTIDHDINPNTLEDGSFIVTIDTTSLSSNNGVLEGHLKGSDFFNVQQYPEARFTSTSITKINDTTYQVKGDLTIKEITNPISFDVEMRSDGFYINHTISRLAFNVGSEGSGPQAVNDEVQLDCVIKWKTS